MSVYQSFTRELLVLTHSFDAHPFAISLNGPVRRTLPGVRGKAHLAPSRALVFGPIVQNVPRPQLLGGVVRSAHYAQYGSGV